MDKTEFMPIAAALRTYYPRYNLLPNAEAMELWYQELKDLPAGLLQAALRRWVDTEKWPPSIAELRDACGEITNGTLPDWGDGWEEVQKAVRFCGYMREAKALESLSPITRSTVERIGWQQICTNENPDTLRAQFRQIFEAQARRETLDRQLPEALKETIARIGKPMVPELEGRT